MSKSFKNKGFSNSLNGKDSKSFNQHNLRRDTDNNGGCYGRKGMATVYIVISSIGIVLHLPNLNYTSKSSVCYPHHFDFEEAIGSEEATGTLTSTSHIYDYEAGLPPPERSLMEGYDIGEYETHPAVHMDVVSSKVEVV